jgi:hypothetical protein
VEFPNGAPEVFSVGFVLSNLLLLQNAQNASQFALGFPAYPSLAKKVNMCNASIVLPTVLPDEAAYVGGSVSGFEYGQANLQEYTYSPASVTFLLADYRVQIADVTKLDREIRVNEFGELDGIDTYEIANKADKTLTYFEVFLPDNASDPSAKDQFGRTMAEPKPDEKTNRYNITLSLPVANGKPASFTVEYRLPNNYLTSQGSNNYALHLTFFQDENLYVNQSSVTFVLPEGAKILSFESKNGDYYSVSRSVFQETITVNKRDIAASDSLSIGITYDYASSWLSFRPTLWVWTLAIVGSVIVALAWRRPKGPTRISVSTAASKLSPEHLKSFVDAYEEKKKIVLEIDSLETRVQKGKVPRRRYKVRRKTLEARLGALSRSLAGFTEKTRSAGGQYADLMRQLEIVETEINHADTNIKSIEARHNRGELSLEAYRKLLADYQRRKEDAEATINGILLRLREETH